MSQALAMRNVVIVVMLALLPLFWMAGSPTVLAEEAERILLAAYVPHELLSTLPDHRSHGGHPSVLANADKDGNGWRVSFQPSREVRRWKAFDAEFSIRQKSPSALKGTLQEAKYNLDQTVFEMDNFVNRVEDALTFEYRPNSASRNVARSYFSPLYDIWENTRLKSEVNIDTPNGRAFVGFTLRFPIGN